MRSPAPARRAVFAAMSVGICAATASLPAVRQEPVSSVFEMRELNEAEEAALPQGEGRDAVAAMCVPCHGVLPAIASRKTPLAWVETVEKMRVKGAQGTDGQAEAAVAYLSKFFPAVDVNTATADELVQIAGFTAEDAAAIVAYRTGGNALAVFADLKKVPGLDAKRLTAAKPRIVFKPK